MDNEANNENPFFTSTNTIGYNDNNRWDQASSNDLVNYLDLDLLSLEYQSTKPEQKTLNINSAYPIKILNELNNVNMTHTGDKNFFESKENTVPVCHVKMFVPPSVTDVIGASALKKLERQTKTLDTIYVEDEDDDCSVYKRLTRKCHCLNQREYNDFIIHFNEETKYFTSSSLGEIIKNLRILKKFLYMGCTYTKNALMFLNEGLSSSTHHERIEIIQGCAYADICNVFDEHSMIIICISWPCKYPYYGDAITQALTASFLYKLVQIEDGRRYLNFSSKITNDMKKVLRKKATKLEFETLESLNATLNLLHPPMAQHLNATYYCKPVSEDVGNKTLDALINYRQYMTINEVFTHLDLLARLSNCNHGKNELKLHLPEVLSLFKNMLIDYDNSEMNIIITNILNNIVSKNMVKEDKEPEAPKTLIIADTATETTKMKNATNQVPIRKNNGKKLNKSKIGLGNSPNKNKHGGRKDVRSSIIVVPIEKQIHKMK